MTSLPRIITVDPTWAIARVLRGAMDLLDKSIIQVDVPGGTDALEELKRGSANLVVAAWELYDDVKALELALRVKQINPAVGVIILANIDGPESLDEETEGEPPFIYMRRPVDIHQFLRVLVAGINGENMSEAMHMAPIAAAALDHGPVPPIDEKNARDIIKRLLIDVGAMALLLTTRRGDVLLEDGAPGYLDREKLTSALMPVVTTNIEMSSLVGGQAQVIQFFDGDDKDVFVFSVGLHHFLCVIFDGQAGGRQFGVVNRYGRQAVQDLIALLGGSAFVLAQAATTLEPEQVEAKPSRTAKKKTSEVEAIEPVIMRQEPKKKVAEPEPVKLDPIQNLDFSIFDQLGAMDGNAADDMFDLDKLADMVNKGSGRKEVSFEEAEELGILGDIDATNS